VIAAAAADDEVVRGVVGVSDVQSALKVSFPVFLRCAFAAIATPLSLEIHLQMLSQRVS
jgi:hypothetical protein